MLGELWKGLADSLRTLAHKDLTKPGNLNGFIDLLLWIVVILLAKFCSQSVNPSIMFYMAFALTVVCIGWCILHYTVLRPHRRQ